jgi:hypothetical protein
MVACPGSLPSEFKDSGSSNNVPDASPTPDASTPDASTPTCTKDVETEIFASNTCAIEGACHGTNNPAGGLDLKSPGVSSRLLNQPAQATECGGALLIDPNNPSGGVFLETMTSSAPCGEASLKMPITGALSASDLACVQEWVASVATGGNQ